ncbi:MAG TPA: M28 family peptidase, partial [Acidimicrobiales bacterium]
FFIYDGDNSDNVGNGPGPTGSAHIEKVFEHYYALKGIPFKGTDFSGRSDYGPFIAIGVDIPSGGLFTGAEGVKTAAEQAIWGGTAGIAYDPCYHQACDTYANNNDYALDINVDAVAYATLNYAFSTTGVNGVAGTSVPGSASEKAPSGNSAGFPGTGEQEGLHDDDHAPAES